MCICAVKTFCEINRACSTHVTWKCIYFSPKHEVEKSLRDPIDELKDNIKMDHEEMRWECELRFGNSELGLTADCCEHDNKSSGPMICVQVFDPLVVNVSRKILRHRFGPSEFLWMVWYRRGHKEGVGSEMIVPWTTALSTTLLFSFCIGETCDRLCGLVVRVLGYRSGGPGSIPGTAIKKEKSSGSWTGSTLPREYNWGATW
jgi:hypothetical protein